MEQTQILSVVCDDVEYRCEQKEIKARDYREEAYKETVRSKWLSKNGAELEDHVAMMLYGEQSENKTRNDLLDRLWK
jgi:hypothetical protein